MAATRQGPLAIGPGAPGRGAWICSAGCFDTAIARGALARALRRELTSAEVADLRATLFA